MSNISTIIGLRVIEAGLWKFYGVLIVFIITYLINIFSKEKGIGENLMIISSIIIIIICSTFIILGHITQLIL